MPVKKTKAFATMVLNRMRSGQALHMQYTKYGPRWYLSGGMEVEPDVAECVIELPAVVGVGDALFADAHTQTYRFTN